MKQQMLEQELQIVHRALSDLVEKTRLMMHRSEHLDPEDMQRTFRRAEAIARKRSVESSINVLETRINSLLTRYGSGVRPDWVGEEIVMDRHQQDMYRQELLELEEELNS